MKNVLFVFVISAFLTGCYTQVAVKDKENEGYQQYSYVDDNENTDENVVYDTVYYDDDEYQNSAENEEGYSGFEDNTVKKYYYNDSQVVLPIVVVDYDPFWANWNHFWYVNSWYSPTNYFYDSYYGWGWDYPYYHNYWDPWYNGCYGYYGGYYNDYYGNYYGGYYGGNDYYSGGVHPGKTRDNDGGRGTKTRTSFGDRGGNNNTQITKTREIKSINKRVVTSRNNDVDKRNDVVKTRDITGRKTEDLGISTSRIKINRNNIKNDTETGREKIVVRQNDGTTRTKDYQPKLDDPKVRNNQNKIDGETTTTTRKKIYIKRDDVNRTTNQYKTTGKR